MKINFDISKLYNNLISDGIHGTPSREDIKEFKDNFKYVTNILNSEDFGGKVWLAGG